MTTSGTIGNTNISVSDICRHAALKCGLKASELTSEMSQIMRDNLFLIMTNWTNAHNLIWTLNQKIIGIMPGQYYYDLPSGTTDVSSIYRRYPTVLTGTYASSGGTASNAFDQNTSTYCDTGSNTGWISESFSTNTFIGTYGFMPYGTLMDSVLTVDISQDGSSWETIDTQSGTFSDGEWYWFDLSIYRDAKHIRIASHSGSNLAIRELAFCSNNRTELLLNHVQKEVYQSLPNKLVPMDMPLMFFFDKQITPRVFVWGVPTLFYGSLVVNYYRQPMDVGTATNDLEIPDRWLQAIIYELASRSLFELDGADLNRLSILQSAAVDAYNSALGGEEDGSSFQLAPNAKWSFG